jgi:hypothetical protein
MGSPISYDLQGQGGGQVITSASGAVTGKFRWVQVITDAEFSVFEADNIVNAAGLESIPIFAGIGIGGLITALTVSSGVVIAYDV